MTDAESERAQMPCASNVRRVSPLQKKSGLYSLELQPAQSVG
jgi:hypothetical protein